MDPAPRRPRAGAPRPSPRAPPGTCSTPPSELGAARRDGVLSARSSAGTRAPAGGGRAGIRGGPAVREAGRRAAPRPGGGGVRDGLLGMVASDPRYLETALADVTAAADDLRAPIAAGLREDRAAELETLCRFARAAPDRAPRPARPRRVPRPAVGPHPPRGPGGRRRLGARGRHRPRALRRLKYEKHPGAVVRIARALAAQENLSGLPTLAATASAGGDQAQVANQQLYEVAPSCSGATRSRRTTRTGSWRGGGRGAPPLRRAGPAPRRLWRLVSDLSGEHIPAARRRRRALHPVPARPLVRGRVRRRAGGRRPLRAAPRGPGAGAHGPRGAPRAASRRRCWTGATPWRAPPRRPWRRSPRDRRGRLTARLDRTPPRGARGPGAGLGRTGRRRWTGCSGCSAPWRPCDLRLAAAEASSRRGRSARVSRGSPPP